MSLPCGCCQGVEPVTPLTLANRPGLNSLAYRVGTYATFFETMRARLSGSDLKNAAGQLPLALLKTRDADDPSIAFLDVWAVVADVLTFYQERIANEGYLRTATERRSVHELARLVGYALRPGVASSVFLAYTVDPKSEAVIPAGSAAQSVPGPGELPQTFETSDPLTARGVWSNLPPRMTQPQILSTTATEIYLDGTSTNLKPNDRLMLDIDGQQVVKNVATVDADFTNKRTKVTLQKPPAAVAGAVAKMIAAQSATSKTTILSPVDGLIGSVKTLSAPPATHPANSLLLARNVKQTFTPQTDTIPSLVTTFHPEVKRTVYTAMKNTVINPALPPKIYAFRAQAAPFGNNAPQKPILDPRGTVIGTEEWPLNGSTQISISIVSDLLKSTTPEEPGTFLRATATTHETLTASVTIKQGNVSASAVFPFPPKDPKVPVGVWEVVVTRLTKDQYVEFEFKFPSPINRDFLLTGQALSLELKSDHLSQPVKVPVGQSVSSLTDTESLTVSYRVGTALFALTDEAALPPDNPSDLPLDMAYDQIIPDSWVIVERADRKDPLIAQAASVQKVARNDYGLSGRVTELTLKKPWLDDKDLMLSVARETSVFAQSEELTLAEEPITDDIQRVRIELGDLYGGLQSGRWLIVQGERTDIPNTSGVVAAELVMLSGVDQDVQNTASPSAASHLADGKSPETVAKLIPAPGEKTHTFLNLASPLAYTYKRDSVAIYGNVARATNGETRNEILGSGDSSQELQEFVLHQSPLTYVASTTPAGAQTTLQVRVNNLLWHEVDTLAGSGPSDRVYITQTDDKDVTTVIFGNGEKGARLPTGVQNVNAAYRNGIGSAGNVAAGQVTLLNTRPLGVTAVVNPLPATGGADRDSRDQARRNVPLAVTALDRLVSVQDYANFARTFAGIGKASAARLSDGHRQLLHVTVAGTNDIPIAQGSDLYTNLYQALQQFGDPFEPLRVDERELVVLVIAARVQVLPDYQWTFVAPQIRATLLDTFGFDKRDLGQSVYLSEVISAIQQVRGVNYVDVTSLDGISESDSSDTDKLKAKLAQITSASQPKSTIPVRLAILDPNQKILLPAQLAFLTPNIPDALILTEITQ